MKKTAFSLIGDDELAQKSEHRETQDELGSKARFIERSIAVGSGFRVAAICGVHELVSRIGGVGASVTIGRKV